MVCQEMISVPNDSVTYASTQQQFSMKLIQRNNLSSWKNHRFIPKRANRQRQTRNLDLQIRQNLTKTIQQTSKQLSKHVKPSDEANGSLSNGSVFETGFLSESDNERANGSDNVSKVITRFPPEQSGCLHIGQSKAIMVNFGFAAHHRSKCYLRFDDTNPKGERQEFYDSIQDIVHWLGFKPARITYSSDNFGRLYELAEKPNRKDGAYVCHCQEAEIKDQRGIGEGEGRLRYACAHQHNITAPSKPKSASFIPSSSLRILSQIQMAF